MSATDVFHAGCAVTRQRPSCLFAIEAGSRYLHIPGNTANPDSPRTMPQNRNLLTDPGDHAAAARFPARDRAGQLTASIDAVLADAGIQVATTPPRSPPADADPERFVPTTRTEATAHRILIVGERHLPTIPLSMKPMTTAGDLIAAGSSARPGPGHLVADHSQEPIKRRPVPGGLLNQYERAA